MAFENGFFPQEFTGSRMANGRDDGMIGIRAGDTTDKVGLAVVRYGDAIDIGKPRLRQETIEI